MFLRSKKSLLSFTLCASLISSTMALPQSTEQWRRVAGLEGASIKAFFSHGDYLFAEGYNGVFRSTDQGQSWKRVNLPGTNPAITSFTAIGETIFASSSDWPIVRSTDNGLTWTPMEVPQDLTSVFFPLHITALAAIGGNLFAGTKRAPHAPIPCGLFRSADNGKNWTLVRQGSIHSLAVIDAELFASSWYGAYRSSDLGNNLTEIKASIDTPYGVSSDISFNTFAVMGKQLFAGTNYGVFVSTDRGMNWRPINGGLPSISKDDRRYVNALAVSGDTLFAGFAGGWDLGAFRFDSHSQSWTEVNGGLLDRNVNAFFVSRDKLFVGTDAGVFVLSSKGGKAPRK
jgi:photosystem II stability/assembly factor-like uncharacterized protein